MRAAPEDAQVPAGLIERLFDAASEARKMAYAPYSRFSVGAAVLGADGRIHAGCNVENAAYPLGQCAEASALAAMVGAGCRELRAIAVVGGEQDMPDGFVTPCGGCRQRIREFARPEAAVHCRGEDGTLSRFPISDLLPHGFGPDALSPGRPAPGSRG